MTEPMTHTYVGPTTRWGLGKGTRVRIVGKGPSGLKAVRDERGGRWHVAAAHLEKKS